MQFGLDKTEIEVTEGDHFTVCVSISSPTEIQKDIDVELSQSSGNATGTKCIGINVVPCKLQGYCRFLAERAHIEI